MKFIETPFENLWEIEPVIKGDSRGYLTRLFCKDEFSKINFTKEFVQENLTFTKVRGTFRGFHYQIDNAAEIKLVRCIKGSVLDIVIDLRKSSPMFLKHYSRELDAEKLNMLFIPEGFAHGFQTLTDDCLMLYLHSNYYNQEKERGIRFNDPRLNITLPLPLVEISTRDKEHPLLSDEFTGLDL